MKKNSIVNSILIGLLVSATAVLSCKSKDSKEVHARHTEVAQYTCPMHPQIIRDKPGKCPICGMDLVPKSGNKELAVDSSLSSLAKPVNAQVVSTVPAIAPESGRRIFSVETKGRITYDTRSQTSVSSRVGGRIEKLYIKYNYQPVQKGQLLMEIYSPDLAAAQRELLFIARSGNDIAMLDRAKQRLSLLGVQPAEITQILKTGQILYRVPVYSNATGYILEKQLTTPSPPSATSMAAAAPTGNDGMDNMGGSTASGATTTSAAPSTSSSPVFIREGQYVSAGQSLFTIYRSGNLVAEFALKPALAAAVKKGQQLLFRSADNSEKMFSGTIALIQPVVRSGENFTLTRVYLNGNDLLPGQLVMATIPVIYESGWWLPKKAVWQSGDRTLVFKKQGDVFVPVQVQATAEVEGMVRIATPIGDWRVAENAWYLVDSESFIKTTEQPKN